MADDRPAVGFHADALEMHPAEQLAEAGVRAEPLRELGAGEVPPFRVKPHALHLHHALAAGRQSAGRGEHRLLGRELEAVVAAKDPSVPRYLEADGRPAVAAIEAAPRAG